MTSVYAGWTGSADELIFARALMGIGAAFIFPATLAIITNAFTDPKERAAAIGVWSATSGVAVAAGPIASWALARERAGGSAARVVSRVLIAKLLILSPAPCLLKISLPYP